MVYYSFIFFSLSSISLLSSFSLYFSINGNHIFIAWAGVAGLPSNKIWRIIMIAMVTLMRIIKVFKVIKVIIVMIGMIKELLTYYVSRKRGKGELAQCMLAIAGRGLRTPHFGRRNLWRAPKWWQCDDYEMEENCERISQLGCSPPQNKGELSFEGNLALKLNPNTISGQYFKLAQKSN